MLPHSTHEIKTYPTTHDHTTPPTHLLPFCRRNISHNNSNIPTMNEQTTWHDTDTKLTLWHGLNPKNALLALLVSVALLSGRRILTLPPPSLRIQLLLEIWGLMCVGGGGGGVCSSEVSRYPLDFCTNLRWLSARRECVTWVLSLNTF